MSNLSHLTNEEVLRHLSGASLTELERELIGRLAGENVYLDDDGAAIAMELGSGNISEGIRIALAMASTMEHVDDLAMLVRRLAHALRKSDPDNPISDDATEYLKRHGLAGSPLR